MSVTEAGKQELTRVQALFAWSVVSANTAADESYTELLVDSSDRLIIGSLLTVTSDISVRSD